METMPCDMERLTAQSKERSAVDDDPIEVETCGGSDECNFGSYYNSIVIFK